MSCFAPEPPLTKALSSLCHESIMCVNSEKVQLGNSSNLESTCIICKGGPEAHEAGQDGHRRQC